MRVPAVLPVLALLLLLAADAAAQAPSASPSITVTAATGEGTVTVEKARSFSFTVKNTSPVTPLDEQNKGDVAIVITGIPEGWTASANPANFEIAPGDSVEVEVQVGVSTDADARSADLTVTAEMHSPLRGLEPLLGTIPGATQRATGNASLSLRVDESLTRDVLETIGPWIYALLLLVVAAVLVVVAVSVAARRTLVRLAADSREVAVLPGGKAVFTFVAESVAKDPDTAFLQVSAVQDGWAAFLPLPDLALMPGQSQELTLVVIAPRDAQAGERQAVLVTATSAKAPKGAATLEFVVVVDGRDELPKSPRRRKG